jgi:two-component system nitrate/nitrite response regulator NarL
MIIQQNTRISILEDHQGIIDGYLYRLKDEKSLEVTGIARFGEDLEPMLATNPTDILILDIEVPTSRGNLLPYPILQVIPKIKRAHPLVTILVISMHTEIVLVEKLVELGISGYIFKNDNESIMQLPRIIQILTSGGIYFSQGAYTKLRSLKNKSTSSLLSARQLEALSLCVAFPDSTTNDLAIRLGVSSSTFRNLLSNAYERLGVHTRRAAIAYLQRYGMENFLSRQEE